MKFKKIISAFMICCTVAGTVPFVPAKNADYQLIANAETNNSEWKKAYVNFLKDYKEKNSGARFTPVYITDDDIPEIALATGNGLSQGVSVAVYYNGKFKIVPEEYMCFGSLGMFSYGERKNIFLSPATRSSTEDVFFSIENGGIVEQYRTTNLSNDAYYEENIDSYTSYDEMMDINDENINSTINSDTGYGTYDGICGENATWFLDDEGTLTISGTGDMEDYILSSTENAAPWYPERESIKNVVIEDGITSIGNSAFYGCTNLTSIEINSEITRIGIQAFYDCESLNEIIIPESVTSIGENAFECCENLEYITLPEGIENIGQYTFFSTGLTEITIPDNVTSIGESAFASCKDLTYVTLPESLENIGGWAFANTNLAEITIPYNVTYVGYNAFSNCKNLSKIEIPDNNINISSDNAPFSDCTNITEVTIPADYNIKEYLFETCPDIQIVNISDGAESIEENFLRGCRTIKEVNIPSSVKTIGREAFEACDKLERVTLPETLETLGDMVFYGDYALTSINIPLCITSLGNRVLAYTAISEITIPRNITMIDENAFVQCPNLEQITIMNPDCEIIGDEKTISNDREADMSSLAEKYDYFFNGTIYGYEGSTAQTYAEQYGYTFIALQQLGDINNDNAINAVDATFASIIYAELSSDGTYSPDYIQSKSADVNGDGYIDAIDATAILSYYAYLSTGGTENDMDIWLETMFTAE